MWAGTSCSSASPNHTRRSKNSAWASPRERIDRVRNGKKWLARRYQWLDGVPLRGDDKAMKVNWLTIEISDGDSELYSML
jgi:hypothetical protein